MKKLLIGVIVDGKAGGVDKYILDFYSEVNGRYAEVDFLTSEYSEGLAQTLRKNGSKLLTAPRANDLLGQYKALKRIVSENNYDIVYFNYSTAIGWTAVKGAHDGGAKKIIVHSHNNGYCHNNSVKQAVFTFLHYLSRPFICKYATDLLSCSDKAANWMFGKKALKNNKIRYIKNEVDDSVYCPSVEKREHFRNMFDLNNTFVIGHVGSMLKAKNQIFLIELLPKIKKYIPNAKLLLVGEGENKASLQAYVNGLKLADDVIFAGYLNSSEGIMNAFDVFCLPSLIEGYPFVAIEAQHYKLPCIFSDRITRQIVKTDACSYVSLNEPKEWVNQIVAYKDIDNIQAIKNVCESEFITCVDFVEEMINSF